MTAIGLTITSPTPNAAFTGSPTVNFAGSASLPPELSGVPIFYRWYSSLFASTENRYSIHPTAFTSPAAASASLGMGSQAITLAASDQSGEDQTAQNAAQHGGVAGGKQSLLIHIFKANLLAPANNAVVSRAGLTLSAEAPLKWASRLKVSDPFTPDADYHQTNRLRYRWVFAPSGAPGGRPTLTLLPTLAELDFDLTTPPVRLHYRPSLPAAADGAYTLTLFVEDNDTNQNIGSQSAAINLTLTV